MSKYIHIGETKIPTEDYAISATAILGIRNSGKTVTAKGIAEQLIEQGIPIVVFDAVGKWRYLKVEAEGGRGFKVVVVGGREPDLPLTPQAIPEIIHASISQNIPLVIDLYDAKLSKSDWRRIVQQAIRILHYENQGVRHIFLEEAAEYIPQRVLDTEVYAEVEKLARMGGNASVGITIINQRAQELNKAVLDLCSNLVVGCQIGRHAINSIADSMEKLSPETFKEISLSLPKLKAGEAWVWTSGKPDEAHRENIPMCRSLHPDRRTPGLNELKRVCADTSSFVEAMRLQIPKVVEQAKANDPAELRREIARLQKELGKPVEKVHTEIKEVPALTDAERKRLTKLIESFDNFTSAFDSAFTEMQALSQWKTTTTDEVLFFRKILAGKLATAKPEPKPVHQRQTFPMREQIRHQNATHTNGESPTGGLRRMLIALAQRPGLNVRQLGVRSGLSSSSGSFNTYLSKGRSMGWLAGDRNRMEITPDGIAAIGSYQPLPEGQELIQHYINDLGGGGAGRIFKALVDAYPNTLTKDELGSATGLSESSGSFNTYLSKLRTLELITGSNPLKASDEFFT